MNWIRVAEVGRRGLCVVCASRSERSLRHRSERGGLSLRGDPSSFRALHGCRSWLAIYPLACHGARGKLLRAALLLPSDPVVEAAPIASAHLHHPQTKERQPESPLDSPAQRLWRRPHYLRNTARRTGPVQFERLSRTRLGVPVVRQGAGSGMLASDRPEWKPRGQCHVPRTRLLLTRCRQTASRSRRGPPSYR